MSLLICHGLEFSDLFSNNVPYQARGCILVASSPEILVRARKVIITSHFQNLLICNPQTEGCATCLATNFFFFSDYLETRISIFTMS